ncbi:MAG: acetolactate synthase small subunit [Alphaproteobacteria bacterium]|nr:acetolactate synthase small subunit [Alphaproteobacteria bacterium]
MGDTSSRHCFALLAHNEPGVLARLLGLLAGRGYNVESLTADEIDHETNMSRITLVISGPPMVIDQVKAQLERVIPVRCVENLNKQGRHLEICMALVKVVGDAAVHAEASRIVGEFNGRKLDQTASAVIYEFTAAADRIDAAVDKLRTLKATIEVARAGSVGMACGEAVLGKQVTEAA